MATPPTPAIAPALPASGAAAAVPALTSGTEDAGAEGDGEDIVTIATICYSPKSGEFTLYDGDEPEEDAGGGGAAVGSGGVAGMGGGDIAGEEGAKAEKFNSEGDLMKAVLEIVRDAQSMGEGSEQSGFDAGSEEDADPGSAGTGA